MSSQTEITTINGATVQIEQVPMIDVRFRHYRVTVTKGSNRVRLYRRNYEDAQRAGEFYAYRNAS